MQKSLSCRSPNNSRKVNIIMSTSKTFYHEYQCTSANSSSLLQLTDSYLLFYFKNEIKMKSQNITEFMFIHDFRILNYSYSALTN